VSDNVAI